jgi:hypothetical protein
MNIAAEKTKPLKLHLLFLICIFLIFITPYSLNFGSGGTSANYLFILLPLFIIISKGNFKIPSKNIVIILLLYSFIFLVSVFYQHEFFEYIDRRIISFIIFMSMFSYLLINIDLDMVVAFKIAIALFSVLYSLIKISDYFFLGGVDLGLTAKTAVGSQRYGFILLLGFWILAYYKSNNLFFKILKVLFLSIILIGLLNTFSRSSIIAFLSVFVIFLYTKINIMKIPTIKTFFSFVVYIFSFIVLIVLFLKFFPGHIEFYAIKIYKFFKTGIFIKQFQEISAGDTVGYRILILKDILDFVIKNPFTGSGFLGCYIMYDVDVPNCSAHSQYSDVLFRTGLFGFTIYLYLLFRIFKYLSFSNRDLFFGYLSILIYGVVHETFKLSHGAFVLSFLLAMTYDKRLNYLYAK